MAHDQASWFGEARALSEIAPDQAGWRRLWALAHEALDLFGPEAFCDIALPYLERMASRFSPALRQPDPRWGQWTQDAPEWALIALARTVELDRKLALHSRDPQRRNNLLRRLDGVTHLIVADQATLRILPDAPLPASIHHLTIESDQGIPESMSRAAWLPQITSAALRASWYGKDLLTPSSLIFPNLTRLHIPPGALRADHTLDLGPITHLTLARDLSIEKLERLLNHPRARHLTALTLERPNCDRPTLEALAGAADRLPALARLEILHLPLWEQAADGFGRALNLPALRQLTLDTCHLSDLELGAMLSHGTMSRLEALDLSGNRVGADGIALLRRALPHTQIRLEGNWVEDALRGAPHTLHLRKSRLPADALPGLARLIDPAQLEHLSLQELQLTSRDLSPLTSLRLPALKTLDLSANALDAARVASWLDHDRWPALHTITLSSNPLGDLDPLIAALSAHAPRLRHLILRRCDLSAAQLPPLTDALRRGWRLDTLDLCDNPLTPDALQPLAIAAPTTHLLTEGTLAHALISMQQRGDHAITLGPDQLQQMTNHPELLDEPRWAEVHHLHIIAPPAQQLWPHHLLAALRGAPGAAPAAHLSHLRELCIKGRARLNAEEAYQLQAALPAGLQVLRLTDGCLTAQSAEAIVYLLTHEQLSTLDLRHNGLSSPDVLHSLGHNALLSALRLIQLREGNDFSPADLRTLERRLPHATVV